MHTQLKEEKEDAWYDDCYDRGTVEECRALERRLKEQAPEATYAEELILWAATGERYARKRETIRGWKERDRALDERVAAAPVPRGISCRTCHLPMELIDRSISHTKGRERVEFYFDCTVCHAARFLYDDGGEYVQGTPTCAACGEVAQEHSVRVGNRITTTTTCPVCTQAATHVLDLDSTVSPSDPDFEADRLRFCLSEQEGRQYMETLGKVRHIAAMMAEEDNHFHAYQALARLKKLSIAELEEMLRGALEKAEFGSPELGPPELHRGAIEVSIIVRDLAIRDKHVCAKALSAVLIETLNGTNGRAQRDRPSYTLGVLTTRLTGFDREKDLVALVKARAKQENAAEREFHQEGT